MTEWLFSGILWIDALRVWGIAFLALLVFGIPGWMLVSKLRWRRRDEEELKRLLDLAAPSVDEQEMDPTELTGADK